MDDIIKTTLNNIDNFYQRKRRFDFFDEEIVSFSPELYPLQLELDKFISQEIIFKSRGHDINNQNKNIIRKLFNWFVKNPSQLPQYIHKRIEDIESKQSSNWNSRDIVKNEHSLRIIADHVAGMTDRFAILEYEKLISLSN